MSRTAGIFLCGKVLRDGIFVWCLFVFSGFWMCIVSTTVSLVDATLSTPFGLFLTTYINAWCSETSQNGTHVFWPFARHLSMLAVRKPSILLFHAGFGKANYQSFVEVPESQTIFVNCQAEWHWILLLQQLHVCRIGFMYGPVWHLASVKFPKAPRAPSFDLDVAVFKTCFLYKISKEFLLFELAISKNRGHPKWMVYNGKPDLNWWFGGTPIFGNTQLLLQLKELCNMGQECWSRIISHPYLLGPEGMSDGKISLGNPGLGDVLIAGFATCFGPKLKNPMCNRFSTQR